MISDMLYVFHAATHPFKKRFLVYEMSEGGGLNYYLGCKECGGLAPLDRYRGLEVAKRTAIHVDQFQDLSLKPAWYQG